MQEIVQKKILQEFLIIAKRSGWNARTLDEASLNAGFSKSAGKLLFPGGPGELLEFFFTQVDIEMLLSYKEQLTQPIGTQERIMMCIIARFQVLEKHRDAMLRASAFLALPHNFAFSLQLLWHLVDIIWYEAGHDKSTDFNYYTKRVTLGMIYSSTMLYWFTDTSYNFQDTIDFLDRSMQRLKESVQLVKRAI